MSADFGGMTVAEKLIEQTGVIGEKLDISSFERVEQIMLDLILTELRQPVLVGLNNNVDNVDIDIKDLNDKVKLPWFYNFVI